MVSNYLMKGVLGGGEESGRSDGEGENVWGKKEEDRGKGETEGKKSERGREKRERERRGESTAGCLVHAYFARKFPTSFTLCLYAHRKHSCQLCVVFIDIDRCKGIWARAMIKLSFDQILLLIQDINKAANNGVTNVPFVLWYWLATS